MAIPAARFDAEMRKAGFVIATADSFIGVTALHYGYAVGTRKSRHFSVLPTFDGRNYSILNR